MIPIESHSQEISEKGVNSIVQLKRGGGHVGLALADYLGFCQTIKCWGEGVLLRASPKSLQIKSRVTGVSLVGYVAGLLNISSH